MILPFKAFCLKFWMLQVPTPPEHTTVKQHLIGFVWCLSTIRGVQYMCKLILNTESSKWTDCTDSPSSLTESVAFSSGVQPWYTVRYFLLKSILKWPPKKTQSWWCHVFLPFTSPVFPRPPTHLFLLAVYSMPHSLAVRSPRVLSLLSACLNNRLPFWTFAPLPALPSLPDIDRCLFSDYK